MGQASSSASSSGGIQGHGDLTINKPNWLKWVVIGVVAIFAITLYLRKK